MGVGSEPKSMGLFVFIPNHVGRIQLSPDPDAQLPCGLKSFLSIKFAPRRLQKNPNGPHSFGLILLGPIQLGPIAFDPIAFVYVDLPLIICVKLYLDYFNGVPSSSVQSLGQTRSARVSRGQQG